MYEEKRERNVLSLDTNKSEEKGDGHGPVSGVVETSTYSISQMQKLPVPERQKIVLSAFQNLKAERLTNQHEYSGQTLAKMKQVIAALMSRRKVTIGKTSTVRSVRSAIRHHLTTEFLDCDISNRELLFSRFVRLEVFECSCGNKWREDDAKGSALIKHLEKYGVTVHVPKGGVKRSASRARRLARLPEGWRDTAIWYALKNSKLSLAAYSLVFFAHTGSRPIEIQSGRIKLVADGLVELSVICAKSLRKEQVRRGCVYQLQSHPWLQLLARDLEVGQAREPFANLNVKQVGNLLRRASGKKSGLNLKQALAIYDFRHQLGADFKAVISGRTGGAKGSEATCGFSKEDLGRFLGHITTRQQGDYGKARYAKGAGGFLPTSVLKSHEVQAVNQGLIQLLASKEREISRPGYERGSG
jgi:hypothetical protein